MSFCRAVTWTSVCHAGLSLSLTPTLRLLKQPLSHSSGPIQYDSPLYGQCGPRFSALRLFVLCVYRRFTFPAGFKKTLTHPTPLHKPSGLILIMPCLLSVRLNGGVLLYHIIPSHISQTASAIYEKVWFYTAVMD